MKKATIITLLLLFMKSFNVFSQKIDSEKYLHTTFYAYKKELKLSPYKEKSFKNILKKYNTILENLADQEKNKNQIFNKTVKLQDLEVYKLLSRDQFEIYKRIKPIIEPNKKYKW